MRVSLVKINGTILLDTLSRCSASLVYSGCTYPAPLLLLSAPIASTSWPPSAVELILMFSTAGSFSVEAVDVASAAVAETPCVSAVTRGSQNVVSNIAFKLIMIYYSSC